LTSNGSTPNFDPFVVQAMAGTPITACEIIDAHGHLGECPNFPLPDSSAASLVISMDRLGIRCTGVSSLPAIFGEAERGNRVVEAALREFPDRFFGYMVADTGYPERILPELQRCLEAGFRAIKIWSYGAKPGLPYDHPNYSLVFEFAQSHRLPVLAHTWGVELDQLQPAIETYPAITWLLAHTASTQKEKYIRFGQQYPNVYLELCYSPCPRGLIEKLVEEGLVEKLIFGSDSVFMGTAQQLGRLLFAQISPQDKTKILGLNARRALGI
jgi:uncharacterized protein